MKARFLIFSLLMFFSASPVLATSVASMTVSNGTLQVGAATYDLDPGSSGTITPGSFQGPGVIINSMTVLAAGGLTTLSTVDGFTSPDGGFLAPSGTVSGTSLIMDMTSWKATSNLLGIGISTLEQGAMATGTVDAFGNYVMSWQSPNDLDVGFGAGLTTWTLEGTLTTSVVPLPATLWLFGSGVLAVSGFARKNKNRNRTLFSRVETV